MGFSEWRWVGWLSSFRCFCGSPPSFHALPASDCPCPPSDDRPSPPPPCLFHSGGTTALLFPCPRFLLLFSQTQEAFSLVSLVWIRFLKYSHLFSWDFLFHPFPSYLHPMGSFKIISPVSPSPTTIWKTGHPLPLSTQHPFPLWSQFHAAIKKYLCTYCAPAVWVW